MTTFFISDLHLDESRPAITELFLHFLTEQASQAQALYILGDLFEAWIGDDEQTPLHLQISAALQQLTQKDVPVYYIHGNRDFLIGEQFLQASGCQLLTDPTVIDLYGNPTLLTHGDILCTSDSRYQRYRRFVQHPLSKKIFLALPLSIRQKIANYLRNKSKQYTTTAAEHIMDVTPATVIATMQQYQVKQLIHGHTHRPAIHTLHLNNQTAKRYVLGAWEESGNTLIANHNTPPKLNNF